MTICDLELGNKLKPKQNSSLNKNQNKKKRKKKKRKSVMIKMFWSNSFEFYRVSKNILDAQILDCTHNTTQCSWQEVWIVFQTAKISWI